MDPKYYQKFEECNKDPTKILDLSWEDDSEDFSLKMTKKFFFASSSRTSPKNLNTFERNGNNFTVDSTNILNSIVEDNKQFPAPSSRTSSSCENEFKASFNVDNVIQCVRVPSQNHVAQILGKLGCKIKILRDATNTYIRSPFHNEEPCFLVKGKKENVEAAVESIQTASDFFTKINQEKKILEMEAIKSSEGQLLVFKLAIPMNFVGILVGVRGATIKVIEKETKTYIQSPIINSPPIFHLNGSVENCFKAMNMMVVYLNKRGVGPGRVERVYGSNNIFEWIPIDTNFMNFF